MKLMVAFKNNFSSTKQKVKGDSFCCYIFPGCNFLMLSLDLRIYTTLVL